MASSDLLERAQQGDQDAFGRLVDGHRRELEVHCYRMLGSAQDAEDALQETLLAAWQGISGFEGRASLRTWLYRIATTRCLNVRRSVRRASRTMAVVPPEPTRLGEVVWLEPYPDLLLDELADTAPGPDARYELRESVALAFITALQLLPARQRAVLLLRDVLGFHAAEAATILDVTEQSVNSALKRARATLAGRLPDREALSPAPQSPAEAAMVEQFARAWETADVDRLLTLLAEDVWLTMPPLPLEYQGRDLVAEFLNTVVFREGRTYHLAPTRANSAPAFGCYLRNADGESHAIGLLTVSLSRGQVTTCTRFDTAVFPRFGLPRSLP